MSPVSDVSTFAANLARPFHRLIIPHESETEVLLEAGVPSNDERQIPLGEMFHYSRPRIYRPHQSRFVCSGPLG